MKSALIYYSHYGNTAKVAGKALELLKEIGPVDELEVEYRSRNKGLLERIFYRFFFAAVKIAPVKIDLKEYGLICFGIPCWAGRPSSPILKYINLCKNIRDKKIICFYIFGIDASAQGCADYVSRILSKKSGTEVVSVFIPWANVHDNSFLTNAFKKALSALKAG